MIAAQNHNESWVGAGHPVSYAITIANLPPLANAMQVNIYLIPVNGIAGGNITTNTSVDNACTNNFGLLLNATGSNYAATVTFKTNSPGVSLPSVNLVASYGSSTITGPASGDGKWVLTFTDNTHGSITGPGLTAQSFVIPTEVAAFFAGSLAVYIGIQPNSIAGVGKFVDFLNISITNGGNTIIDDFHADTSPELDASKWATVGTGTPGNVVAVPVGSAYWINWTTPAVNYDVEVNSDLTATNNWINPASYAGYEPGPLFEPLEYANIWTLISTGDLPPGATNAFFRMSNSPKY